MDSLDPQQILFGDHVIGSGHERPDVLINGVFFEDYRGWSGTRQWAIKQPQIPDQIKPEGADPSMRTPMIALDSSMVFRQISDLH